MFRPHTILHPTDLTETSNYALQIAVDLARANHGKLILLHVAHTPGPEQVSFAEVGAQLQPEGYHQQILQQMHEVLDPVLAGIPVDYLIAEGTPASEIDRVARERHCDLIVTGSHGFRGVERLLFGSVAEHVVRYSRCPVLVARDGSLHTEAGQKES